MSTGATQSTLAPAPADLLMYCWHMVLITLLPLMWGVGNCIKGWRQMAELLF